MQTESKPTQTKTEQWIWILEDEPNCRFVYDDILAPQYQLRQFATIASFEEAIQHSQPIKPHLIIADLRLSDGFFLDTLAQHKHRIPAPFMVVSSVHDTEILRDCFSYGARDFMTKPFNSSELLVKVERLLCPPPAAERKIAIDQRHMRVSVDSATTAKLTRREMQIMQLLNHAGHKQMARAKLIQSIWGDDDMTPKNLDVHLVHLRRKLKPVGLEISMVSRGTYRLVHTSE